MNAKYVVGIDLGTTNSVVAYAPLDGDSADVSLLPIPQFVAADTTENLDSLPSFLYLPTSQEIDGNSYLMPWQDRAEVVLGELARRQSSEVPTRTVGAAKSWLAHSQVDRRQAILPWNAPEDVHKISPVSASQHYLTALGRCLVSIASR